LFDFTEKVADLPNNQFILTLSGFSYSSSRT